MRDLVSVCIPVYNGEKYLEACLNSVLSQTYQNIEILIIDDGSKDDSINIAKRLQLIDSRIKIIVNDINLGLVGNWNKCIDTANGKWIKFIFQDDIMNPTCIEKMIYACIDKNVQFCICSREFLIENSANEFLKDFFYNKVFQLHKVFSLPKKFSPEEISRIAKDKLFYNFIGEPIVLFFHKDIIKKFGNYNPDLVQLVDYEFALRVCLNIESYFLPEKLVKFRVHSESASNNQNKDYIKQLKNQFIEPLVLLHEYNFNSYFKLLKREYGPLKLFKEAFFFYLNKRSTFVLPDGLEKHLMKKYKGLILIMFGNRAYLFIKKFRKNLA